MEVAMNSYSNMKAYRAAGLTLKGCTLKDTAIGLFWSCTIYRNKKKVGSMSSSGCEPYSITNVPLQIQSEIVSGLKENLYEIWRPFAAPIDDSLWLAYAVIQMIDEVARLRKLKRLAKTHMIVQLLSTDKEFIFYRAVPHQRNRLRLAKQLGADLHVFMNDEISIL
jgi:hypothetical protein